ncbi:MAG: MFS transporter [Candidatus Methanoperedens sp.]
MSKSLPDEVDTLASNDRRLMYYISLLGFFAIFSTTISKNPVLPLFMQSIGSSDAVIGLISAISPFAGILFSFPVGVLSDRLGRRRLLITAGAIFLIAPLLYIFIDRPLWMIPMRFFHGTATAILGPVISAIIVERFFDRKGEMLGKYASSTLIGRTLAPITGGVILSFFAAYPGLFQFRIVYVAAALAAVPVFVMTLLYREKNDLPLKVITLSVFKESFVNFFSHRRLRGIALVDMATYFAFGTFETFLPIFLASIGFNPYQTGIIFAVQVLMIATTKPVFGWISDRVDKRIQICVGLLVSGISIAAISLSSSFPQFIAISIGTGLGISLSTVATSAYVADIARREEIGASMGALSSTMDIGHSMGPLVTGIIITAAGFTAGFFASFVLALVITGVFVWSVFEKSESQGP